ncbi:MAG: hypothetical protein ACOY82_06965 [Pseudomonadota bacterium]
MSRSPKRTAATTSARDRRTRGEPEIAIELAAPAQVQGAPARHQSLWLLLRLWLAAQSGEGWVREAQLREQFANARNLRMIVSRAYTDFARWGLRVGWGTDRGRDPDLLPLAGRNRGPYWLAEGQAERLRIVLHGAPAGADAVSAWLGASTARAEGGEATEAAGFANASPAYWHAWAGARRDMLDGRLILDREHGALAGYRRALSLTDDPWLRALALLQQAMVWRRAGNADAARKVLAELDRHWHDEQAPEHAWLGAMAAIVQAWCAYAGRDPEAARQILRQATEDPRWIGLFRYHPRVRCEHANLQALIHRSMALDERAGVDERTGAARTAVRFYRAALALANEAELFDVAASTASNLGWSLWLFERCGLVVGEVAADGHALGWIGLAAWLSGRHGVGGGCWNTIYLLRMVRAGGPDAAHPRLDVFRRWPVLSPEAFRALIAPIALNVEWSSWRALANTVQADVDAGRLQVDALQRANVLLEVAWYEAHDGDPARSAEAAGRLRRRLRELTPADRIFFRDALRRLPEPLT